jgi:hypothetical protein
MSYNRVSHITHIDVIAMDNTVMDNTAMDNTVIHVRPIRLSIAASSLQKIQRQTTHQVHVRIN